MRSLFGALLAMAAVLVATAASARPFAIVAIHLQRDSVVVDLGSVRRTANGTSYILYIFLAAPPENDTRLHYAGNVVETDCKGRQRVISTMGYGAQGQALPDALEAPDPGWAKPEEGAPGYIADELACGREPKPGNWRRVDTTASVADLARTIASTFAEQGPALPSPVLRSTEGDTPR